MSDLLSLAAPSYEELAARRLRPPDFNDHDGIEDRFGRYRLHTRIPAGPGDECFVGLVGDVRYYQFVFVRRLPGERLGAAQSDALKRRAMITRSGIEQIFELAGFDDHSYLVTELIQGVGLDHLDAALRQRRERLSWTAALAMLHDACECISHLRAAGIIHGDVTPARLRLSITGRLTVCYGVPSVVEPAWARVLCDVARPILRLAATADERALLDELLRGAAADEAALAVASDALVQQHGELEPILPLLLRSMLEGAPPLGGIAGMLRDGRPQHAIHRLWQLVAEVIATPRPPPKPA